MGERRRRQARVASLTEATRTVVRAATLPRIAHIMEMSPRMLEEYLAGARHEAAPPAAAPFTAWLQKAENLTDPHAKTLLGFVVGGLANLPEEKRMAAAAAILRELSAQYVAATGEAPEWVQQLLALCPE
jgi:hypothetical protein